MIHMQTKQGSKQAVNAMLKAFYRMNTFGKNEMLTAIFLHYPEYYQEFIDGMDKQVYEKYMVKA